MTYGVQEKSMKKCVPIIVVSFVTFVLLHMSEHVKLFPKGGGGEKIISMKRWGMSATGTYDLN